MTQPTTALTVVEVDPAKYDLDTTKAREIDQAFEPLILQREAIMAEYATILSAPITEELCKQAHELRLKLVKVRTGMAAIHKTQKHLFLMAGKFVDAIKNANTEPVAQMESTLMEIQNHFVAIEQERIAQLGQDRTEILLGLDVEDIPQSLGLMLDDIWAACLMGYQAQADKRKEDARIVEEQRVAAEQQAIADAEAERVRVAEQAKENERLQEQARQAEADRQAAEAKVAGERRAAAAAARRAKDEAAAKIKAVEDKAAAEKAARDNADRERQEADRKRQVAESNAAAKAEQDRRDAAALAASSANRSMKNGEAIKGLVAIPGVGTSLASHIVAAIQEGNVPNVTMNY